MTSSALIAHLMDPLIDPMLVDQDRGFERIFSWAPAPNDRDDPISRDFVRGFKRAFVYALDWAGDKMMVSTRENPAMRLYDPEKEMEERSWAGEWMALQTDPNNPSVVAAISWGGKFRVFDTRSSEKYVFDVDLKRSASAMKEFLSLAWSPDSKHIALNNRADQVYILNLQTAGSLKLGASKDMQIEVNQMVWGPEGETLWVATGGIPGKIHVLPAPSLRTESSVAVVAHQQTSISIAADPTGRHIATGGNDCLVTLWDPKHLICTSSFGFATQAVQSLSFSHDGNLLAWGTGGGGSTGGEKNVTIVGANTGVLYAQESTNAPATHVKWHPKRNALAYAVNTSQLPEDGVTERRARNREVAVVHILKMPDGSSTPAGSAELRLTER